MIDLIPSNFFVYSFILLEITFSNYLRKNIKEKNILRILCLIVFLIFYIKYLYKISNILYFLKSLPGYTLLSCKYFPKTLKMLLPCLIFNFQEPYRVFCSLFIVQNCHFKNIITSQCFEYIY